tara:strand:+ start:202 stop:627 length:426 start_codon:yes stop_codon:yes gene_type:complete
MLQHPVVMASLYCRFLAALTVQITFREWNRNCNNDDTRAHEQELHHLGVVCKELQANARSVLEASCPSCCEQAVVSLHAIFKEKPSRDTAERGDKGYPCTHAHSVIHPLARGVIDRVARVRGEEEEEAHCLEGVYNLIGLE